MATWPSLSSYSWSVWPSVWPQSTSTVTAVLAADALAIGTGTLTTGSLTLQGTTSGLITKVSGTATATATATGTDAYASAGTFGTADGADIVLTLNFVSGGDGSAFSSSSSTTQLLVLDLAGFESADGPITRDAFYETLLAPTVLPEDGTSSAIVTADASAAGSATYAQALTTASAYVGSSDITGYTEVIIA